TARQARLIFNTGAYGAFTPNPIVGAGPHAVGAYRIAAVEVEWLRVYTNHVPAGNMRAPGAPQCVFAEECHTDIIAREMGIDPLEFRLKNALVDGDTAPLGHGYHNLMARETLQAAAEAAGWNTPKPPNVGRG